MTEPVACEPYDRDTVLAVVVTYRRSLQMVECGQWLRESIRTARSDDSGLRLVGVLIYDNSPTPMAADGACIEGAIYHHNAANGGTAAAYAKALELARQHRAQWLLLLDQDTTLPANYLVRAKSALLSAAAQPAAMLPWVVHGKTAVSPSHIGWSGSIKPLRRDATVRQRKCLTGIASGCLVRREVLQALLPFPEEFWLDYLDHWMFLQIHRQGGRICTLDTTLQHDLSVLRPKDMPTSRMLSILTAEASFMRSLGWFARATYPFRLAARALRISRARPELARAMLGSLLTRGSGPRSPQPRHRAP